MSEIGMHARVWEKGIRRAEIAKVIMDGLDQYCVRLS